MHPQLERIADEYRSAERRLHELARSVPVDRWNERSHPERWSVAECVAHLNLASTAYLPLLADGVARARALGVAAPTRYRRDPVGWLLWRIMGPPVRVRLKTTARFVPTGEVAPAVLVEAFDRLQAAQLDLLAHADGLPLAEVRVTSPFDPRARYNLYACFTILPRHQHRHLWQAERVWPRTRSPA